MTFLGCMCCFYPHFIGKDIKASLRFESVHVTISGSSVLLFTSMLSPSPNIIQWRPTKGSLKDQRKIFLRHTDFWEAKREPDRIQTSKQSPIFKFHKPTLLSQSLINTKAHSSPVKVPSGVTTQV